MTTRTQPNEKYTDQYGIERANADEPGVVDKVRDRQPWIDHLMRMQERFSTQGGNQYSAGITYFSVMSIFPLAMLTFAVMAMVVASRPELLQQIQDQISGGLPGDVGDLVNQIIEMAIAQRGAVFGIGAVTALWSGLGWMNNLRAGIGAMWGLDPSEGGNFITKKIYDFIALVGLIIALVVAFGVTAIGSSGLTQSVLERLGIAGFPGMSALIFLAGLLIGLLANFLVMYWMMAALPRTKVPRSAAFKGALVGAVAFELVKQLSTVIFASAVSNPAGAIFGPIIGLMIVLYLVWRVVMYVAAWTATTLEALMQTRTRTPDPAVIHVRNEVHRGPDAGAVLGAGAALGAAGAGLVALLTRRR